LPTPPLAQILMPPLARACATPCCSLSAPAATAGAAARRSVPGSTVVAATAPEHNLLVDRTGLMLAILSSR